MTLVQLEKSRKHIAALYVEHDLERTSANDHVRVYARAVRC